MNTSVWSDCCLTFLPNQPWPPSAGSASWPCYGQIPTRVRVDDSRQEKPIASTFRGAWCCCQRLWPGILLLSLLVTQTTHKTLVRYKGLAFAFLTMMANHSGVNKTSVFSTALSTAYSLVVGWLCVCFQKRVRSRFEGKHVTLHCFWLLCASSD